MIFINPDSCKLMPVPIFLHYIYSNHHWKTFQME